MYACKSFLRQGRVSGHDLLLLLVCCVDAGGRPASLTIPGSEYTIDSDGFFELEEMPKKVALIGAGYVAVEFAGIFAALKADTHLFVRHSRALRKFDELISQRVDEAMRRQGVQVCWRICEECQPLQDTRHRRRCFSDGMVQ